MNFLLYLNNKNEFLLNWLNNGYPKNGFSIKLISNIKGLLLSFLYEISNQKDISIDQLILDFSFSFQISNNNSILSISDIYLLSGNIDSNFNLIIPNQKTPLFLKMPYLIINPIKRISKKDKNNFLCPLFKSLPNKKFCLKTDLIRIDGEIDNFIRYIPLKSDISDKFLITSNTSLICHIPEIFN